MSLPLNSAGAPTPPPPPPPAIAIPFQDLFVSAATKASTMAARGAAAETRDLISVRMRTLLKMQDRKVAFNIAVLGLGVCFFWLTKKFVQCFL